MRVPAPARHDGRAATGAPSCRSSLFAMLSALQILIPIFALILAGFVMRRRGIAGPAACSELNRFVVWLALPALLFKLMAHASWAQLYQPAFMAAFGLSSLAVFILTLAWRLRAGATWPTPAWTLSRRRMPIRLSSASH